MIQCSVEVTYRLVNCHLARVAAEGSECRNAAGTGVTVVVDTIIPMTVGAVGGERAITGSEPGATACGEEHIVSYSSS